MLQHHGLGNEREYARIEVHLSEIDELNAHLLAGGFHALGQNSGEGQTDLGILQQQIVKIFLLEHGASRRLQSDDSRGAGLAGEQRHLPEVLAGAHFREQKINVGVGIFFADFYIAAGDEKHGGAGSAFADDDGGGREVAPAHALDHLLTIVVAEGAEQLDALQKMRGFGRLAGRQRGGSSGRCRRGRSRRVRQR